MLRGVSVRAMKLNRVAKATFALVIQMKDCINKETALLVSVWHFIMLGFRAFEGSLHVAPQRRLLRCLIEALEDRLRFVSLLYRRRAVHEWGAKTY